MTSRPSPRWRLAETWDRRLFDGGRFLPPTLVASTSELKRTRSRVVERVVLADGGRVVVKHYLARGLEVVGRTFARSPAAVEFDNALRVRAAGVAAVEPLAAGVERSQGRVSHVFVSRDLGEVVEMRDLVCQLPSWPAERRRALISAMGRLFRKLHDAGLALGDPHLGNFLVDARDHITIVDLRRVDELDPRDLRARAVAIARLIPAVTTVVSTIDAHRFLDAYGADLVATPPWRAALARARRDGEAALLRRGLQKAAGAIHGDRRVRSQTSGGVSWMLRQDASSEPLAAVLADPERCIRAAKDVLKSGRTGVVVRWPPFVVKRSDQKRRRNVVLDRVRPGRVRRTFSMSILLEALGIRTPRVFAAGELRRMGLVIHGYLVAEEVRGARHLGELVRSTGASRWLLREVGRLIARLHAFRIDHRDLKANNIVVDERGTPWLVDLDGVSVRGVMGIARRAHNLGRLIRDIRHDAGGSDAAVEEVLAGYFGWSTTAGEAPLRRALARAPRG